MTTLSRRSFIATLAGAGAFLAMGIERAGSAPTGHSLAWRLDSHWGYPAGPRGLSHCQCNACVNHATNKVFASQAAADGERAHAGCRCQTRAVQVKPEGYAALFPDGTTSVDLRGGGVASTYRDAIVHGGPAS